MIITVEFKTPEALTYEITHLTEEKQIEEADTAVKKWLQSGKKVTVELDTEKLTAKAVEV